MVRLILGVGQNQVKMNSKINQIYIEYVSSCERIKNNFFLGLLSINFINQRPFYTDIQLNVNLPEMNIIKCGSLNTLNDDAVQEYGNSLRRTILNDSIIAYEKFATRTALLLAGNHIDHCEIEDRKIGSHNLEAIAELYTDEHLEKIKAIKKLRNSIIHFNGVYNVNNKFKLNIGSETFDSCNKIGQNIRAEYSTILQIHDYIKLIVENVYNNAEKTKLKGTINKI